MPGGTTVKQEKIMEVTANLETLMRQAPMTAEDYFRTLGDKLPGVNDTALAILALAAAVDFHTAITAKIHTDNTDV